LNKKMSEAVQLVESGQVEKGLKKLSSIEKELNDEEKFELAEKYFQWGRTDEALKIAEELSQLYPDESAITLFLAEIYIELDDEEKAIDLLNEIDQEDESYPQALLLMADLYQLQGLYEVSEQKLKEAKRRLPEEKVIDFALAEHYFHLGKYRQAIDFYRVVLEEFENIMNVNIHKRIGESLSACGEFEEALAYFEKAVEEEDLDTYFAYGMTALNAGQTKTAIAQFERIKELDTTYHSLYLYLAKSYEQEGMVEKSFQIVQEGLQEDPFNKELYLFGGKIALKLKDVDNAVKLLKKALELDPVYIEAIITLSGVLLNQGKYVETIEMLTEIVERHEEYDPHFDFNLAIAYHRTEQYEKALKHYESAYNNFKTDPEFLENYAYFLLEEGERAKARKLFEKALELDPGNIEYENMLLELEDNF